MANKRVDKILGQQGKDPRIELMVEFCRKVIDICDGGRPRSGYSLLRMVAATRAKLRALDANGGYRTSPGIKKLASIAFDQVVILAKFVIADDNAPPSDYHDEDVQEEFIDFQRDAAHAVAEYVAVIGGAAEHADDFAYFCSGWCDDDEWPTVMGLGIKKYLRTYPKELDKWVANGWIDPTTLSLEDIYGE